MANQVLRFTLDFSNIEEADDGNTTHYGGHWVFNGVEKRGYGDDRSDSFHEDVYQAIVDKCRVNWPGHVCLEDTDAGMDFDASVRDAYDDLICAEAAGTISIREAAGLLVVTLEKA